MMSVRSAELEQVDHVRRGNSCLLFEFTSRSVQGRFVTPDPAARQGPSCAGSGDQQDTVAANAQYGCPVFHPFLEFSDLWACQKEIVQLTSDDVT